VPRPPGLAVAEPALFELAVAQVRGRARGLPEALTRVLTAIGWRLVVRRPVQGAGRQAADLPSRP
jgi:hypothetical protein